MFIGRLTTVCCPRLCCWWWWSSQVFVRLIETHFLMQVSTDAIGMSISIVGMAIGTRLALSAWLLARVLALPQLRASPFTDALALMQVSTDALGMSISIATASQSFHLTTIRPPRSQCTISAKVDDAVSPPSPSLPCRPSVAACSACRRRRTVWPWLRAPCGSSHPPSSR